MTESIIFIIIINVIWLQFRINFDCQFVFEAEILGRTTQLSAEKAKQIPLGLLTRWDDSPWRIMFSNLQVPSQLNECAA